MLFPAFARMKSPLKPLLKRLLLLSLVAAGSFWLALVAFLWTEQEKILFIGASVPPDRRAELEKFRLNEVQFDRGQGVILRGHHLPRPGRPLVVYYGGNAEEVSWHLADLAVWGDCGVLLVNYRGYGDSSGKPTEADLVADAQAILDETIRKNGLKEKDIILMGRSLGGGVAMQVAATRKVGGLILVTPFDSVVSVGQGMYPFAPMGLIARHPFDSVAVAGQVACPTLILACRQDEVIPLRHSEALAKAFPAANPPRLFVVESVGHNDVHHAPEYREKIKAFLDTWPAGAVR